MENQPSFIVHSFEEVTPYNVIRVMEYRWASQFCEGMKVMDLGCGTGSGTMILGEKAREIVGVDTSHASIEIAKKMKVPSHISFKLVVEGQLPFENESFDVIVANNVIERIYNPTEIMIKVGRILKPGGILVVATVNRLLRLYFWQKPYNELHFREFSPATLKLFLGKYFREVHLHGIRTTGPFFPDLLKNSEYRKFRLGVYFPVRNFLRAYFRPFLSAALPRLFPPVGSSRISSWGKRSIEEPIRPQVEMEDACHEVTFVKNGLNKCSEIIAVCKKR